MSMFQRHARLRSEPSKTGAAGDRLVAAWGPQASDMARIMAFRAEAGLLHEPSPGFWAGVARAIVHKIGVPDAPAVGTNLLVL